MIAYVKIYVVSLVALCVLDFTWLGFVAKDFNTNQLQGIARIENGAIAPFKAPAIMAYLVMALALTAFGAPHALSGTWLTSIGWGALLGLSIYGIYDFTNLAVLKDYPPTFAVADLGWGTFSYATANLILFASRAWLADDRQSSMRVAKQDRLFQ